MKSAYAELIGAFFAKGGSITRCPDGVGLGEPLSRRGLVVVGGAKSRAARHRKIRDCVLAALKISGGPLTLLGIETVTGIPFEKLRGAIASLERDRIIQVSGSGSGRTRFFSLADTGAGLTAGGPASASTAEDRDPELLTAAVRPGRAA